MEIIDIKWLHFMAHFFQTLEAELCAFWMFFFINCIFQIQILQIFSKYFSKLKYFTSKSVYTHWIFPRGNI